MSETELEEQIMEAVADLTVQEALETGRIARCPNCRILHPRPQHSHPENRGYCSAKCRDEHGAK